MKMTPLKDPRSFPAVLQDWLERHDLSHYAAAKALQVSQGALITRWLGGARVQYEPGVRAMMTIFDADGGKGLN